jgi:hypothetical protein
MHDVADISERIVENCRMLASAVVKLDDMVEQSGRSQAEYDKLIGVAMAKYKAAGEPVGVIKEYAKRDCSDALCAMVVAEGTLRACYANIDAIKTRINAYQSILKYLDVMEHE